MKKLPHLLVSDKDGNIFPHPSLKMAGRSAIDMVEVPKEELIPLPEGSEIFTLPGRTPFGWDEKTQELVSVDKGPLGQEAWACAAFMAPAHTQFLLPAYRAKPNAPRLPLFAYTAVGELYGKLFVPAGRIDPDSRQDLKNFSQEEIARRVKARLKAEPKNRLVAYLSTCALVNACPGAKNFFLGRWEAPLPTSPACNSDCVGCLSFQAANTGFPSTQNRIQFTPTADEVVAVAAPHLASAPRPVVSFGQGCEGEPLMNGPLLLESIRKIRKVTPRGIINVNTNGSKPGLVWELVQAGLDAIRVSMNSAQEVWYNAYYRPRGYTFADVKDSVKAMVEGGGKASINYLVFPGVSDREAEIEALISLVKETDPHLIQWRNLNLDPDLYLQTLGDLSPAGRAMGVPFLLGEIRRQFPTLRYGYFNPPWATEAEKAAASK
jgi:pyruvate-formate lyase-activating enzyme